MTFAALVEAMVDMGGRSVSRLFFISLINQFSRLVTPTRKAMQKRRRGDTSPASKDDINGHVLSAEGDFDFRKKVLQYLSYFENQIDAVLCQLLNHMAPDEPKQSKVLLKSLSRVTESGVAPSFGDSSSRTGYTQRRFKHRAAQVVIGNDDFISCILMDKVCFDNRLHSSKLTQIGQIGIMLFHPALEDFCRSLLHPSSDGGCDLQEQRRVISIGCGPGSDGACTRTTCAWGIPLARAAAQQASAEISSGGCPPAEELPGSRKQGPPAIVTVRSDSMTRS